MTPCSTPASQRVSWADALVEIAQRSLDGARRCERRERFRVNWFIDPTDPVPARWADGLRRPRLAARDVDVRRHGVPGVHRRRPAGQSSGAPSTRCPNAPAASCWPATASVGCRGAPRPAGCRSITSCTGEHGGPTDTANLVAICPADHRLHHHGQLGITGNADDPDGLTFTDRHGRVIDPAAHPILPTGPPPAPAKPYEHPIGERLQRWAVVFPDPPPPAA